MTSPFRRLTRCVLALTLAVIAVLPYLNATTAGFTFDDWPSIQFNPAVVEGFDPTGIFASPGLKDQWYRPLTMLTFALNETLTPGRAGPFHVVNIGLHAIVTLLVFYLGCLLFASEAIGACAALLFAVHPIHTEAVTSLVGRAELLAALFGVLALLSAAWRDTAVGWAARAGYGALSLLCFSLALLSKESAVTVLPLLLLLRIALRGDALPAGLQKELRGLDWVPYALCAALFIWLRTRVLAAFGGFGVDRLENVLVFVPWTVRIPSALGILWDYFGLLNIPLVLAADYSYNQVPLSNWLSPRALVGAALVVAAACVALRNRRPAVGFAVLLPFVSLTVTANLLFPIGTIKAERLLYLPSIGWALLVGYAFQQARRTTRYRTLATVAFGTLVAGFAIRTWVRNWDWANDLALYRSMVRTAPESAKAHYNYGAILQERGAHAAAVAQFHRTLEIYPIADAAVGIGLAAESRAAPEEAIAWYTRAIRMSPSLRRAHASLCAVLLTQQRWATAEAACRDGLRYDAANPVLLKAVGDSLIARGKADQGLTVLQRALALDKNDSALRADVARWQGQAAAPGGRPAAAQ